MSQMLTNLQSGAKIGVYQNFRKHTSKLRLVFLYPGNPSE